MSGLRVRCIHRVFDCQCVSSKGETQDNDGKQGSTCQTHRRRSWIVSRRTGRSHIITVVDTVYESVLHYLGTSVSQNWVSNKEPVEMLGFNSELTMKFLYIGLVIWVISKSQINRLQRLQVSIVVYLPKKLVVPVTSKAL